VAWAAERFAGRLVASTSFGAHSAVMLDLVARVAPETPIVFIDTGYLFPETYRFAEQLTRRLGLDVRVYAPRITAARQEALYGQRWEHGDEGVAAYLADNKVEPMQRALKDAQLAPSDLDYVNAHATATLVGDRTESSATAQVLGATVPVSSTKAFTGHTLGACGALEAAFCVAMMEQGFLAPSRNLYRLDKECAPLDYIMGDARPSHARRVMTNNFAFGGINTSLILGARP